MATCVQAEVPNIRLVLVHGWIGVIAERPIGLRRIGPKDETVHSSSGIVSVAARKHVALRVRYDAIAIGGLPGAKLKVQDGFPWLSLEVDLRQHGQRRENRRRPNKPISDDVCLLRTHGYGP